MHISNIKIYFGIQFDSLSLSLKRLSSWGYCKYPLLLIKQKAYGKS